LEFVTDTPDKYRGKWMAISLGVRWRAPAIVFFKGPMQCEIIAGPGAGSGAAGG
jgi:hypothetical protein